MNKGQNFRYIQFFTNSGVGYACVSFEWEKTDQTIKYSAGVSFCSPKDVFSKERARRTAEFRRKGERVGSKGMTVQSTVPVVNQTKFVTNQEFDLILKEILAKTSEMGLAPTWAIKAFDTEKYRFSLREEQNVSNKSFVKMVETLAKNITSNGNVSAGQPS